jgi:hypothetical protein
MTAPVGSTVAVGKPSTATPGTTPSGTAEAGTSSGTTIYRITGLDREQLSPHVGHKVELQGRLSGNVASPPEPSTPSATAGEPARGEGQRPDERAGQRTDGPADIAGVLYAKTIKMVSATCP